MRRLPSPNLYVLAPYDNITAALANGTTYLFHLMLDLADVPGGDFAYLGFTSSTGDSKHRHEVYVTSIQGTVFALKMPSISLSVSSFPSKSPPGALSLSSAPSNVPSQAFLGSISGNVKADSNDGIGDENFPNIPIELLGDSGSVVALTLADIAGNYTVYDLPIALHSVMTADGRGKTIDNAITVASPTTASGSALNSTGNNFVDKTGKTISDVAL